MPWQQSPKLTPDHPIARGGRLCPCPMSTYEQSIADAASRRRRIADYYQAGHSIPETAREFGLSNTRVSQVLDKEGVPKRSKHRRHKS